MATPLLSKVGFKRSSTTCSSKSYSEVSALLPSAEEPVQVSHLTYLGKRLLPKRWLYNPYLLY